jgi:hypothetical protein
LGKTIPRTYLYKKTRTKLGHFYPYFKGKKLVWSWIRNKKYYVCMDMKIIIGKRGAEGRRRAWVS